VSAVMRSGPAIRPADGMVVELARFSDGSEASDEDERARRTIGAQTAPAISDRLWDLGCYDIVSTPPAPSLTFAEVRAANVRRCETSFHPLNEWSPSEWACAMAGEAGEACNEVKKLCRLAVTPEQIPPGSAAAAEAGTRTAAIADELADVVCYVDLLAARLGIDLAEAIRSKFNHVSAKVGSAVRL